MVWRREAAERLACGVELPGLPIVRDVALDHYQVTAGVVDLCDGVVVHVLPIRDGLFVSANEREVGQVLFAVLHVFIETATHARLAEVHVV